MFKFSSSALAVVTATVVVAACDPASQTPIRVGSPSSPAESSSQIEVSTLQRQRVVKVVTEIALRNKLTCSTENKAPVIASCSRSWEANEDGHARSISVSVSEKSDEGTVEVSVMEWLAFRHSPCGRRVLDELDEQLRTSLGSKNVFR
jgi:hypothetical protein